MIRSPAQDVCHCVLCSRGMVVKTIESLKALQPSQMCNKTGRWPALFLTLSLTLWRSLHYITLLYLTFGRSFLTFHYSTLLLGGLFISLLYSTLPLGRLFISFHFSSL